MRTLSRRGHLLRQCLLALVGLFVLAPVWVLVLMATDGSTTGYPTGFHLLPTEVTLDRFAEALRSEFLEMGYLGMVRNSLLVAGSAALVSVAFGATMAYAFARLRFPGSRGGLVAILLGSFLPPIVLGLPLFVVFPFSRLVHIWSAPVWYVFRPYQVVRRRTANSRVRVVP